MYFHVLGDRIKAEASLCESLAIQRSLGAGAVVLPGSLAALGQLRCSQGRWQEGRALILESLALAERFEDAWAISEALQVAAQTHRNLGDHVAAEDFARRCIQQARHVGRLETRRGSVVGRV